VRLAQRLREEPGASGLLSAVSGMLTKQGVSLWSQQAGPGFASADVSAQAERATSRVEVAPEFLGTARVAGYTVLFAGDRPTQTIALCDTEDGARAVAVGEDPALAQWATANELCGREVEISAGGVRLLD
jgi:acetyl-CoA C-acetyltransferase